MSLYIFLFHFHPFLYHHLNPFILCPKILLILLFQFTFKVAKLTKYGLSNLFLPLSFLSLPLLFHQETILGRKSIAGRAKMAISGTGIDCAWIINHSFPIRIVLLAQLVHSIWLSNTASEGVPREPDLVL